jgi:hypothetical protein
MTQKRPLRRRFIAIPFMYKRWLWSGKPGALVFLEPKRVEALWDQYGEEITERFARRYRFARPPNWWRYHKLPERKDPAETQSAYLRRHPELLFTFELDRLAP